MSAIADTPNWESEHEESCTGSCGADDGSLVRWCVGPRGRQARPGSRPRQAGVGTGSTNAPWHFKGADGKLQGFDIDMAKIIAKALFDDPEKVEFVNQSSDARIPNIT